MSLEIFGDGTVKKNGNTALSINNTPQVSFENSVSQPGGFSFRNTLINAQGLINQRGYVSGTNTSGVNQYTVDRWRVVTSGQNLAFTTSENNTTFTAPAGGVEQVIEGLNLETGTYVLSWTGTATATVGGVSVTNGGTVSVTGGTNTTIRFSGGTFSKPQFEPGTAPTTFERRPIGLELSLCQRYFYNNVGGSWTGYPRSNTDVARFTTVYYPIPMRVAPTTTAIGYEEPSTFRTVTLETSTALRTSIFVIVSSSSALARFNSFTADAEL